MFKIEKIGRHYNGYMHIQRKGNAPAYWKPLFPAATILSSILGALEREISDAAIQL